MRRLLTPPSSPRLARGSSRLADVLERRLGNLRCRETTAGGPMSDRESSSEGATPPVNDWNTAIITEFRANQGRVGGNFEGAPVLLLHTTGKRSGKERVNPMMYLDEDGRIYVFASKAGHHAHPDWYHNLVANSRVTVELGTDTFEATATPVEREERDRIYAVQASRYPGFAEYQQKTTRVIPVVELVRD
jgi:deazaflavin-dependent oxidoreductase (nitroreductase family)